MNYRTISKLTYRSTLVLLLSWVFLCPIDKSYGKNTVAQSCAVIFDNAITPLKNTSKKAKEKVTTNTKAFYHNFKNSWGLNIFFKLVTEKSAYVQQSYAGFLSQRREAKKIKWEKGKRSKWILDKVTNSLFYYMELPLHGTTYLVTKKKLKQIEESIENQNKKYISISYSVPRKGFTPEELEAIKQIFLKIKKDHGDDVVVIHSFLNYEFVKKLNAPTDFLDMFNDVFPNQESYFKDLDSYSESRQDMASRLEEVGGTSYFIGDLTPSGMVEEIETYSSKNFIMKHLEFTLVKGPLQKVSTHPLFFKALNYLSEKLNGNSLDQKEWKNGVDLTIIGNISLVVAIMYLPVTNYFWQKYETIDPFTQTVEAAGRGTKKLQENIALQNESITLNFFIENDPRFGDIKVKTLNGELSKDESLELARNRLTEIRDIIAQGIDPQKPETVEDYTKLSHFFVDFLTNINNPRDENSSEENFNSTIKKYDSLSPVEIETLERLALFDHPMFREIGLLTVSPELVGSVDELPWIKLYQQLGFEVDNRNIDYIDLNSPEGLKTLDDRIINKIESFLTINHVFKYLSQGKISEELPDTLRSRVELRINDPVFKSLNLLYENDQISVEERNSRIIKWLATTQFEELAEFLGVYKQ